MVDFTLNLVNRANLSTSHYFVNYKEIDIVL